MNIPLFPLNNTRQHRREWLTGAIDMLPLCLAVVPWGILAGSMAVQSGLTLGQSIGMSAIVFAGAAQLVTLGLLMSGASVLTIMLSVFFITSQHFLYGLTLREYAASLAGRQRLALGFLLTDELFALSGSRHAGPGLSVSYLLGAGLTFYIGWVLFSLLGIVMANAVPNLDHYHLDFSIVATFITLVVPMIKHLSTLVGVLLSLLLSMLLSVLQIEGGIIIAGCSGMVCSVLVSKLGGKKS
ncbi:AzlC family ABC transporter permease [Oceanimonas baumannii]|uniref:Branched-chain amino acid ABC transporter permease n=1 Tax=Oceanimonas baumannii TaxID=129578 RepID=A0A235CDY7_9GAMM|nr:AzlC family ABC transporter permease [Oceanimonas baumannii]OYD22743.1 branched-chain amino acid ABC transporter permease [Oceanimonas baumannii]TDW57708.1 putative branched-subunit amino acid permease [Oceanimonas baumannii]